MERFEKVLWTEHRDVPIEDGLLPIFADAAGRGYEPYWWSHMSTYLCFGIGDQSKRAAEFSGRGGGRKGLEGPLLEVHLFDGDSLYPLGPYFGLAEYACVAVNGYNIAKDVAYSWLGGAELQVVLNGATFFNRRDISSPLQAVGDCPPGDSSSSSTGHEQ